MAEGGRPGLSVSLSPPGAFLIALLLGAGLMLVFHLCQVRRVEAEMVSWKTKCEVAEKECTDLKGKLSEVMIALDRAQRKP